MTIYSDRFKAAYHSIFGALNETQVVFIESGLKPLLDIKTDIAVLEIGFGSGLNACYTCLENTGKASISYTALEKFPVPMEVVSQMADTLTDPQAQIIFKALHSAPWNVPVTINDMFTLNKLKVDILAFRTGHLFDLIYFDAFAPETQPELWTEEVFENMASMLPVGGILTTYCAKGYVKRNMMKAGFKIEALPGPPRKREITRAVKFT